MKDRNPPTWLTIVSPDKNAKPLPAFLQKKPSPKRKKTINSLIPAKSVRLDIEQKCGGLKTALNLEKEEMEKLERKIADALKWIYLLNFVNLHFNILTDTKSLSENNVN